MVKGRSATSLGEFWRAWSASNVLFKRVILVSPSDTKCTDLGSTRSPKEERHHFVLRIRLTSSMSAILTHVCRRATAELLKNLHRKYASETLDQPPHAPSFYQASDSLHSLLENYSGVSFCPHVSFKRYPTFVISVFLRPRKHAPREKSVAAIRSSMLTTHSLPFLPVTDIHFRQAPEDPGDSRGVKVHRSCSAQESQERDKRRLLLRCCRHNLC